jgi:hypothetical protein
MREWHHHVFCHDVFGYIPRKQPYKLMSNKQGCFFSIRGSSRMRVLVQYSRTRNFYLASTNCDLYTNDVAGSHAYVVHAILHDWPDEKAKQQLGNTRDAMVKGYPKLFVYDIVLPPTRASISQTPMDVNMMLLLSASKRTSEAEGSVD